MPTALVRPGSTREASCRPRTNSPMRAHSCLHLVTFSLLLSLHLVHFFVQLIQLLFQLTVRSLEVRIGGGWRAGPAYCRRGGAEFLRAKSADKGHQVARLFRRDP